LFLERERGDNDLRKSRAAGEQAADGAGRYQVHVGETEFRGPAWVLKHTRSLPSFSRASSTSPVAIFSITTARASGAWRSP